MKKIILLIFFPLCVFCQKTKSNQYFYTSDEKLRITFEQETTKPIHLWLEADDEDSQLKGNHLAIWFDEFYFNIKKKYSFEIWEEPNLDTKPWKDINFNKRGAFFGTRFVF